MDENDDALDNVGGGVESYQQRRNTNYPDYERDEELFGKFIREHTILTTTTRNNNRRLDDDDSDEDDEDDIPVAPGATPVRRVPCYRPHLQRIKDRNWYTTNNNNSHRPTFLIEVPLSEIIEWDGERGRDLVTRVVRNTMRYHDLFCNVLDTYISNLTPSDEAQPARSGDEIWNEQRLALQQQQQQAQQQTAAAAIPVAANPYIGAGPMEQEEQQQQGTNNNSNGAGGATQDFPPLLMRRYELRILPVGRRGLYPPFLHQQHPTTRNNNNETTKLGQLQPVSLRNVKARHLGKLVTVTGMVVRASDVKPSVTVAVYACDACGAELYQVVQNLREFMPITQCPAEGCPQRNRRAAQSVHLQTRGSKFTKYQELKLQELPNQVPMGHVPRSMPVLCRGELTRQATPGDVITVDGVFLPQRLAESGYRAMKAGLIATTYLEAQNITVHKKSYEDTTTTANDNEDGPTTNVDPTIHAAIMDIATGPDPLGRLSSSIAPEIFGHVDIKRALLLQLVGGCTRTLPDGMRIRGDVNICLMGDPGVAKSQLLKHVASIAPRGVYTTGKGSSGVGLTAAVTKDLATGEMALEGGALVLADRGICAIDEFDKMDESDRTAIHEVMEQQTVSIAKAGIVATLNARTSVLAAANPLYGRYNRHKSLSENINLPNSLLSRFDLLFLILDVADVDKDMALARHVTLVHQNEGQKATGKDAEKENSAPVDGDDDDEDDGTADKDKRIVSPLVLREYIAHARQHHPVVPPEVAPYIVEAYVSLRMQDAPGSRRSTKKDSVANDQTVMTARQLLSILRLSQAVARLRFSDFVAREDVDEAIRLTHMSKSSLSDEDDNHRGGGSNRRSEDVVSRIFQIIRDYATISGRKDIELKLCEAMVLRKGFTVQQLETCLEEYEALGVIQINHNRTHLHFLEGVN